MKAIISTTYEDKYMFFLPLVTWCWNKIGVDVICFMPKPSLLEADKALLINQVCGLNKLRIEGHYFECPEHKEATFAQCSRLYGGAIAGLNENEILITSDIDMATFGSYLNQAALDTIQVFGSDLVPENQFPICYISAAVRLWRQFMQIDPEKGYQYYLDELLGPIECEHFKGNFWSKDQETAYNKIMASNLPIIKHNRANYPNKFATRRNDRDGWQSCLPENLIDAHLPRSGYTEENFNKILTLFKQVYPDENFDWMINYHREYVKLLDGKI